MVGCLRAARDQASVGVRTLRSSCCAGVCGAIATGRAMGEAALSLVCGSVPLQAVFNNLTPSRLC